MNQYKEHAVEKGCTIWKKSASEHRFIQLLL